MLIFVSKTQRFIYNYSDVLLNRWYTFQLFYTVIIACFGIFLSVFVISEFDQITEKEFVYVVWSATLVSLTVLSLIAYQVVTIPKKEQLRYYQKAGITSLPLNKKHALSLCRVDMYYNVFWLETLEHYPLKSRVENDNYSYKTIYLS